MRSILTLSLPADLLADLKRKARSAGVGVSAYIRKMLEHEQHLVTEDELLARWKRARKNYREGKVHVLHGSDDFRKKP